MKKFIAIFLTALLLLAAVPSSIFAGRFTDVADGKWYSEAISFCAANGYMDGVAEGVFDRTSNLSRSMFVTILAKIDGVDLSAYEGRTLFSDVNVGRWYSAAITWAAENGYASGIGADMFGYKGDTTREQIALFFYTYASLNGIDVTAEADLSAYTDLELIHSWALDAVEWAVAAGLISGTTATTLNPRGVCTRAEAAVMIHAFVLGFLTECEHAWVDATCTEIGYCTNCELKSGTELGHTVDNGLCLRCNKEVFVDEHGKLVYYLQKEGDPLFNDDSIGHIFVMQLPNGYISTAVFIKPNDDTVYLKGMANIESDLFSVRIEIPDLSGIYNIYGSGIQMIDDESYGVYYDLSGGIFAGKIDVNGKFTLYDCQCEAKYKSDAISMTELLLPITIAYSEALLNNFAYGMSLEIYGFNMNNFVG